MIEDLNEKVANLEQERDGVSTELATSKQSLEQLKLEREALERSLAESRQTAYDLEARIAGIVAERDNILKLYEQLAQEIENEDAKRMAAGNTDNADPVASMQAPAQSRLGYG